jgi:hypothetical protein
MGMTFRKQLKLSSRHFPLKTFSLLPHSIRCNGHGRKFTIAGLLAAASVLTAACLCCPTNFLSLHESTSANPVTQEPMTAIPISSTEDFPACVDNLTQLLEESESNFLSGTELANNFTLVTYNVSGDAISDPELVSPIPESLEGLQQDTATQNEIWQFVVDVIPADQRTGLKRFVIFTDGVNNTLGAVEQTGNPHDWILELDIEDATNFPNLSTTLIHEFAHLLTLNDSQVEPDYEVLNNPNDQSIYDRESASCPTYFLYGGCSLPDSYINAFFRRFWQGIFSEWQTINTETDQAVLNQKLDHFYQEHADRFVSNYAATSPEEDIAESFMYFIFEPKPSSADIGRPKVLFFYNYPEMVVLREHILGGLCAYADR